MCWFSRLAGLTDAGVQLQKVVNVAPLNSCRLLFGLFNRDRLAQVRISIPLLAKLAISESRPRACAAVYSSLVRPLLRHRPARSPPEGTAASAEPAAAFAAPTGP